MKQFSTHLFLITIIILTVNSVSTFANIYDVNSLAATNTGTGTSGTLRYCITQANLSLGPHTINFSVAGTISINSSSNMLPALSKEITIDATTAPGYAGVPVIILDGTGSGSGNGLEITGANCKIYGLQIQNFPYRGLYINGEIADNFVIGAAGKGNVIVLSGYYGISVDAADNGIITYNKVGTDATGTVCEGNNYDGIDFINASNNNQVLFNHVSCNGYNGIQVGGSSGNVIKGNVLGPLNGACQGNAYRAIDIEDGSNDNIVGGTNPSDFNKIAGNLYWGIQVKNNSSNNLISGNSYLCNEYGAIDLDNNGNNNIQPPLITSATTTTISGTASPNATVEVFKSQNTNPFQCAGTPANQGADFVGSTLSDASGIWSLSGTFGGYVTATATDATNNSSEFSTAIYTGASDTLVNECSGNIISVTATFSYPAGICEKACIDFVDQSQNAASWQWYFPGASPSSSTDQNPTTICYNDPGTYPVTLVAYDANGIDSAVAILYITVHPNPPIPVVTEQGDTLISSPAVTYQWYLNTTAINGATDQQYIVTQTGFYYVEISDSVGCTSISQATYVDLTGVATILQSWIEIHALNESSTMQLVIHGMAGKDAQVMLYDLFGRMVAREDVSVESSLFVKTIYLPDAAAGIYFIKVSSGDQSMIQKLILH